MTIELHCEINYSRPCCFDEDVCSESCFYQVKHSPKSPCSSSFGHQSRAV